MLKTPVDMTKEVKIYHVLKKFSSTPSELYLQLKNSRVTDSVPAFSFLGNIHKKRIYYSTGFEKYFAELDFIKNFGYMNLIPEPFRFWIKKAILFLFKKEEFFLPEAAIHPLRGSFQYLVKSDVLGKILVVEHTFEPVYTGEGSYLNRPEYWYHFCYLKKEDYKGESIPFCFKLFIGGQRAWYLEKQLQEYLAKAFVDKSKDDYFSKRELAVLKLLKEKDSNCRSVSRQMQRSVETTRTHQKNILFKGRQLFGMDFQTSGEVAQFLESMKMI